LKLSDDALLADPRERRNAMRIATALLAMSFAGSSLATLPPPTEQAKAQAALTAARTAWTDKVAQYKLCLAIDRTAARYRDSLAAAAKQAPPAIPTPACVDPGPYVPPIAAAQPPLEAAGAHSPPATAVAPPSTNSTAAELTGGPKK
jgi:hypothetical protein